MIESDRLSHQQLEEGVHHPGQCPHEVVEEILQIRRFIWIRVGKSQVLPRPGLSVRSFVNRRPLVSELSSSTTAKADEERQKGHGRGETTEGRKLGRKRLLTIA